jgi:hypothetical protein
VCGVLCGRIVVLKIFCLEELIQGDLNKHVGDSADSEKQGETMIPNPTVLNTWRELSKADTEEKKVILFHFWNKIVPAVSGVNKWESGKKYRGDINPSTMFTVSDEAFALVVVENNFSMWVDEYRLKKKQEESEKAVFAGGAVRVKIKSENFKPLYTDLAGTMGGKSGWAGKGLDAFNRLYKLVENDREAPDMKGRRESMESEFRKWLESSEKENAPVKAIKAGTIDDVPRRSLEANMFSALLAKYRNKNAGSVRVSNALEEVQNLSQV